MRKFINLFLFLSNKIISFMQDSKLSLSLIVIVLFNNWDLLIFWSFELEFNITINAWVQCCLNENLNSINFFKSIFYSNLYVLEYINISKGSKILTTYISKFSIWFRRMSLKHKGFCDFSNFWIECLYLNGKVIRAFNIISCLPVHFLHIKCSEWLVSKNI